MFRRENNNSFIFAVLFRHDDDRDDVCPRQFSGRVEMCTERALTKKKTFADIRDYRRLSNDNKRKPTDHYHIVDAVPRCRVRTARLTFACLCIEDRRSGNAPERGRLG